MDKKLKTSSRQDAKGAKQAKVMQRFGSLGVLSVVGALARIMLFQVVWVGA